MNVCKFDNPYFPASVTITAAWQRDVIGRKMWPEAANCHTSVVACSDTNKYDLLGSLWAIIKGN